MVIHPEETLRGFVNKIKNMFAGMKDPSKQCGALEHDFNGVLCLAATAMVFGANGPTAVEEFGKNMRWHVLRAAGLLKVPSHDTIGRVLDMVDPMDMDRAVQVGREIEDARRERVEKVKRPRFRHVSVDGKMMCGSGSSVNDHAAVGVVNAWDVGSGRNVATVPYPGRGQEVAAARTLLGGKASGGRGPKAESLGYGGHVEAPGSLFDTQRFAESLPTNGKHRAPIFGPKRHFRRRHAPVTPRIHPNPAKDPCRPGSGSGRRPLPLAAPVSGNQKTFAYPVGADTHHMWCGVFWCQGFLCQPIVAVCANRIGKQKTSRGQPLTPPNSPHTHPACAGSGGRSFRATR